MRIIIVGAGAVGSYLAERLSHEGQDVVIVEADGEIAEDLQGSLDCLVIHGNGASRGVLEEAGIGGAELLIAVTDSDAANILACQAAAGFDVPKKVARVEDPSLRGGQAIAGVDVVIDPGETLSRELVRLVHKGKVSEMVEYAAGELVLLGGFVQPDAPLAGVTLAELRSNVTEWDWIVAGVVHDGDTLVARGDSRIEVGDHVMVMAKANRAGEALGLMGLEEHLAKKVIILGATRLAELTARLLSEAGIATILIDRDPERCRRLASMIEGPVVVQGDPTDPKVLRSEAVENADLVMALTGWDEVNIIGCMVAKALGVPTTVARFHRFEFVSLLAGVGVDVGVSSRLAAANAILRLVRRGRIHSVATFQDTSAEAIELQVEADSLAIGQTLEDIHLPKSVIVGGILRENDAFVPHGDTVVRAGDRLIFFTMPDAIPAVEKLFS
jgi:trk system potassium uptake protein TrkA